MIKIIIKIVTIILFICALHSCMYEKKRSIEEILNLAISKVISDSLFISYRDECIEDFDGKFLIREEYLFSFQNEYFANKKQFELLLSEYKEKNISDFDNLKQFIRKDSIRYKNFRLRNINESKLNNFTLDYKNFLDFDFVESKVLRIEIKNNNCPLKGLIFTYVLTSNKLVLLRKGNYNY